MSQWQVCRNGVPLASGPISTLPPPEQQKSMKAAGLVLLVDGKPVERRKVSSTDSNATGKRTGRRRNGGFENG